MNPVYSDLIFEFFLIRLFRSQSLHGHFVLISCDTIVHLFLSTIFDVKVSFPSSSGKSRKKIMADAQGLHVDERTLSVGVQGSI